MKRIIFSIGIVVVIALALASCKQDEIDYGPGSNTLSLIIKNTHPDSKTITFGPEKTEYNLNQTDMEMVIVNMNYKKHRDWIATPSESWIHIHKDDFTDVGAYFLVTVDENTGATQRTGRITVRAGNLEDYVNIVQQTGTGE